MAKKVFSKVSPTYRAGKVGSWQDSFDEGLIAQFKAQDPEMLEKYGYHW